MNKSKLEAEVMLEYNYTSKRESIDWIQTMVTFYRYLPIEYRTIFYHAKNGLFPEYFPEGCADTKALHEFAKDEALEMAHTWVFGNGERDDYNTMPYAECRAVLHGGAIDKLLDSDHGAWMRAAQA